jgi:hypothetical protein
MMIILYRNRQDLPSPAAGSKSGPSHAMAEMIPAVVRGLKAIQRRRTMPEFDELTVLDLEGRQVRLASLWAERRVVLAFLRHFG